VVAPTSLDELVEHSADPGAVRNALDRLAGEARERIAAEPSLAAAVVAVMAASRSGTRLLETDAAALDVLADLDAPAAAGPGVAAVSDGDELVRAKRLAHLRIAARDLLGYADLERTTADIADVATAALASSVRLAGAEDLAVVGMGKLGGRELNYASDVDVVFVEGDPRLARAVMDLARRCYRVDANLRPEGRDGALTRSVDSYRAYWERWAQPWEFQALLKAVPVAGDPEVGRAWADAAAAALWGRRWTADDLRSLRALRDRAAAELRRQGAPEREVKRGPGGIRDIEFAVQTLQLVHGGADPELRSPTTLTALAEMASGGYVAEDDADGLSSAYRFLRRVEHALQIEDDQQVHTVPADRDQRRRLARVLGYRGSPDAGATEAFDRDLARHRNLVRSVHERIYFRPLLDALAGAGRLSPEAAAGALASFGFADVERTRAAVRELTQGLTRTSRMMQQLLPLLLDWLSLAPDPDLGLLGLRKLATGDRRATALAHVFRDSPDVAPRLCELLGTSALLGDVLGANPDLIPRLADPERLQTLGRDALVASAASTLSPRSGATSPPRPRPASRARSRRSTRRSRSRSWRSGGSRGASCPTAATSTCSSSTTCGPTPTTAPGSRTTTRGSAWPEACCGSWRGRRRPTASTPSTPRCVPKAGRASWRAASTATGPTSTGGPRPGSGRRWPALAPWRATPSSGSGSEICWPEPCGTGPSPRITSARSAG
jgi:[glutamine synthetase] adenylyltransferase / [glutamine synthetase]-adenylyl-L-tyrosine phosphorylase